MKPPTFRLKRTRKIDRYRTKSEKNDWIVLDKLYDGMSTSSMHQAIKIDFFGVLIDIYVCILLEARVRF